MTATLERPRAHDSGRRRPTIAWGPALAGAVRKLDPRGLVRQPVEERFVVPAADPERGRALLKAHGCVGCHTVPGVPGADGRVGPRLDRLREQAYIAGVLPNSPQNMVTWIQRPKEVDPKTAMPNLGVSASDARDIAWTKAARASATAMSPWTAAASDSAAAEAPGTLALSCVEYSDDMMLPTIATPSAPPSSRPPGTPPTPRTRRRPPSSPA